MPLDDRSDGPLCCKEATPPPAVVLIGPDNTGKRRPGNFGNLVVVAKTIRKSRSLQSSPLPHIACVVVTDLAVPQETRMTNPQEPQGLSQNIFEE